MKGILTEEQNDRDAHRVVILALTGFSFTGLLALTIVNAQVKLNLHLPVYYLMVSFLSYTYSLNLQGYKSNRRDDLLSDTLLETALLSLILCISSIIWIANPSKPYSFILIGAACFVWLIDFCKKIRLTNDYLKEMDIEPCPVNSDNEALQILVTVQFDPTLNKQSPQTVVTSGQRQSLTLLAFLSLLIVAYCLQRHRKI
jgi:hypothetical protein